MLHQGLSQQATQTAISPTVELAEKTHIATTREILACVYSQDREANTHNLIWIARPEHFGLLDPTHENRIMAFCSPSRLRENPQNEREQVKKMCAAYCEEFNVRADIRSNVSASIDARFRKLATDHSPIYPTAADERARLVEKLATLPQYLLAGISEGTSFLITGADLGASDPFHQHGRSGMWIKPSIILTPADCHVATLAEESTHALDSKIAFCFGPSSNRACQERNDDLAHCITVLRGKGEEYLGLYSLIRNKNYFEYHPRDYGSEVLADMEAIPLAWNEIEERLAAVRGLLRGENDGSSIATTPQAKLIVKLVAGVRQELSNDAWLTSTLNSQSPDELCLGLLGARALELRDQFRGELRSRYPRAEEGA